MTKYDFKVRRGVFKRGNLKSNRNFDRFSQNYQRRRKRDARNRMLILMIGIAILVIILLFAIRAFSYVEVENPPEQNIVVTNQIL